MEGRSQRGREECIGKRGRGEVKSKGVRRGTGVGEKGRERGNNKGGIFNSCIINPKMNF